MRRFLLLAALLPLLLFSQTAQTAPNTPYAPETMLRYPLLSERQQALFDLLYQSARLGDTRVELPPETRYDDAVAAVRALADDCPELAALDPRCTVGYLQSKPDEASYIHFSYIMPVERQDEMIRTAQQWAEQAQGDAFERELFLHDLLCRQTVYDSSAVHAHSAFGALMDGRAVCDGYAKALALLLRMAGIPCSVAYGQTVTEAGLVKHAWNIMRIDGAYTLTDATYNDQNEHEFNTHWYFNLTDEQMRRTHIPDEDVAFPACEDESVGWHARMGCLVDDGEGGVARRMHAALATLAETGAPLNLRFARQEDYQAATENISAWIEQYNAQCPPALQLTDGVRLFTDPTQRCLLAMLP